jgi:hypothetical protein
MLTKELTFFLYALEEMRGQSSGSDWALLDGLFIVLTALKDNAADLPAEVATAISEAAGDFQVAQRNARPR